MVVELPLTRILGFQVPIGDGHNYKYLRLDVPSGWPTILPVAEIRFNRLFTEKPVDVWVQLSDQPDFSKVETLRDVEKIIFVIGLIN
jgi:hypothetical protein